MLVLVSRCQDPCNTSGPLTDGFLVMPLLGATDGRQQIVVTGVGVGSAGRYRGGAGGEAVVVAAEGVETGCGQRTSWRASFSSHSLAETVGVPLLLIVLILVFVTPAWQTKRLSWSWALVFCVGIETFIAASHYFGTFNSLVEAFEMKYMWCLG